MKGNKQQIANTKNPSLTKKQGKTGELQYKPTAPNTEPSIKSKSAEHKTKASFRTSIWGLKNVWWRAIFLKPLNLYVRPVSGTFMWNLLTLMWSLDLKPLCGILFGNLYVKLLSGTFMTNLLRNIYLEPLCGTSGTWIILWNLSMEPWNLFLWNPGTCESGTFMWNLGEPELLRVEPWWGTCTFMSETYVEPSWGTWFPAAAPNHPEALLEEPQAFQAVGTIISKPIWLKPLSFSNTKPASVIQVFTALAKPKTLANSEVA